LDPEETYLVVMSDELSPEKMRSCWIYWKNKRRWSDIQSIISKDLAQPFALIVYQWKTNENP
jgi:hypothetical protein